MCIRDSSKHECAIELDETSQISELYSLSRHLNDLSKELETSRENAEISKSIRSTKNSILKAESREFKSPIRETKAFIELAISQLQHGNFVDAEQTIKQCWSNITELNTRYESVAILTALENKVLTINPEWLDIEAFFNEIQYEFNIKRQALKGVDWYVRGQLNSDSMLARIDTRVLSIVVSNLIDRSIQATSAGFISISYLFEKDDFVVIIRDSGRGIPNVEKISEALSALDSSFESNPCSNSGRTDFISLNKLVKHIKGSMELESKEGLGSRITLRIPAEFKYKQNAKFTSFDDAQSKTPLENDQADHCRNILIIDDDETYLSHIERQLSPSLIRRTDLNIVTCSDVLKGIIVLEEMSYDLILINYHLMEMTALEFLRFLRTGENMSPTAYCVVCSDNSCIPEQIENHISALADEIITESVALADLKRWVRMATLREV